MPLVLASASPRRRELLRSEGLEFDVDPAHVDERQHPDEAPAAYIERIARAKAQVVARRHLSSTVIAADTAVIVDGEVLGKPADDADAARMLRRLSGRAHEVWTGVAVLRDSVIRYGLERTTVWMRTISEDEVDAYVRSGEPLDKAGAYAIQGQASRFVERIEGSWSNVVGLPMATVLQLLEGTGD